MDDTAIAQGDRAVLVLPTFNEIENLDTFIRKVRASAPLMHILIVDDNSPDGTGALADRLATELGKIQVLHRSNERGLGSAYRTGFRHVLSAAFDLVITMDADFSHDPAMIPQFLSALGNGSDIVVGSRYCVGGSIVNWPLHRKLLSKWGNAYTRRMLKIDITDCTTGYRGYTAQSLRAIETENVLGDGYVFLSTILKRASEERLQITEVPIRFLERELGTSKMSWKIVGESMMLVTLFGVRRNLRKFVRPARGK
jgi:dolichol-phosphate mannosyltransferase